MMTKTILSVLTVSVLALTGCGGGDDSSDSGDGGTTTSTESTSTSSASSDGLEGKFAWFAQKGFETAATASNSVLETENPKLDVKFETVETATLDTVCAGLTDAALIAPMSSTPCDLKSADLGVVGNTFRDGGPAVLYYLEDSAVIRELVDLIEFHAEL
jgi:hypothetical protein